MGMFDTIICEYKLPTPPEDGIFKASQDFQTKDLENILATYEIREDGTFWEKVAAETTIIPGNPKAKFFLDRIDRPSVTKWEWRPVNITQTIDMYDYVQQNDKSHDFSINYKVTFIYGKITKVEITEYEILDNTDRKIRDLQFIEEMKMYDEFNKTVYYRYFYKYYKLILRRVFHIINRITNWVSCNQHKIERSLVELLLPRNIKTKKSK